MRRIIQHCRCPGRSLLVRCDGYYRPRGWRQRVAGDCNQKKTAPGCRRMNPCRGSTLGAVSEKRNCKRWPISCGESPHHFHPLVLSSIEILMQRDRERLVQEKRQIPYGLSPGLEPDVRPNEGAISGFLSVLSRGCCVAQSQTLFSTYSPHTGSVPRLYSHECPAVLRSL